MKRYPAWLSALFLLGACSSGSSQSATLILNNPTWDRVNVEAVITNSADCGNRGDMVVRPHEDQRVARAADELAKAVADIEQRAIAQAPVKRRVPVGNDDVS